MEYIPKDLIQNNITLEDKWKKLIKDAFQHNKYVIERAPPIAAKVSGILNAEKLDFHLLCRYF